MARRFLCVSLGILALVLAYQIGASRTDAQGSAPFVAFTQLSGQFHALTSDGDVWYFDGVTGGRFVGNILTGPVPVEGSSWGQVKSRFGK